jgi:hypothetical protein
MMNANERVVIIATNQHGTVTGTSWSSPGFFLVKIDDTNTEVWKYDFELIAEAEHGGPPNDGRTIGDPATAG